MSPSHIATMHARNAQRYGGAPGDYLTFYTGSDGQGFLHLGLGESEIDAEMDARNEAHDQGIDLDAGGDLITYLVIEG